jgi:cyclopropane-fatty-acyl-phospholipid synthase
MLLDIGCGWAALLPLQRKTMASEFGWVTMSAQQKLAQQHCKELAVTILLQDYRDLNEQADRIVSVGMFEHVGPKNYPAYFEAVDRNLKHDAMKNVSDACSRII